MKQQAGRRDRCRSENGDARKEKRKFLNIITSKSPLHIKIQVEV